MEWLTKENYEMNGMTEGSFILDTNSVIFLTTKGKKVSTDIQDELNNADLYISVITPIALLQLLLLFRMPFS